MSERIEVNGLRAMGRHGFAHELHHTQPFEVDVALELDASEAIRSDDLAKTVDYGLVVQEVRRVVEQDSYALVESLADAIAKRLLEFGPRSVTVRVSKPVAALSLGVDEVAVELERHR